MGNPSTGWYETFFRNYDPALGRFTGIDPLATKFASLSGYDYSFNNPVMYNDPLGATPVQPQPEPGNPWFSGGWTWNEMGLAETYERMGMGHIYADQQSTHKQMYEQKFTYDFAKHKIEDK